MKPLLEPAEHTGDDAIAWAYVHWHGGPRFGPTLWTRSLMSDRRDALLMLTAQRERWLVFVLPDTNKLNQIVLLRGGPWRAPVS